MLRSWRCRCRSKSKRRWREKDNIQMIAWTFFQMGPGPTHLSSCERTCGSGVQCKMQKFDRFCLFQGQTRTNQHLANIFQCCREIEVLRPLVRVWALCLQILCWIGRSSYSYVFLSNQTTARYSKHRFGIKGKFKIYHNLSFTND